MRIRSRLIYPVSRPPIENGGLFISNDRIVSVGDWDHIVSTTTGDIIDLGETVVLPGLINAHCHLDYTDMAGKLPPPRHFPDWIKGILALKAGWSFSEYAASWLRGAEMLLESGTTTVADIEAVPELLPDLWASTPLRIRSFLEMTGVRNGRLASEILAEALSKVSTLPTGKTGLSPHALYSTKPDLLELTADALKRNKISATMHVAESREEFEMYSTASGPLFDWLKNQRDMSDCGNTTPVRQLKRTGLLGRQLLAVHVNYLGAEDARILATTHCSVVHCPSSHAYFHHDRFPFDELKAAGVNICLGTDSLASCSADQGKQPQLNMFLEMQRFARQFPEVSPEEIVRLATVNAAKALQIEAGEISPNALADFIALPFSGIVAHAPEAILHHQGSIRQSWISGQKVFP